MWRVVLDTNVYISAVLFGGKPERIRLLAKEGEIEVLVSEAILFEIAEILRRKFRWTSRKISHLIDDIRQYTILITPCRRISRIKEDEPDNRILECAVEGEAHYIVSGDKRHLLPLKEYRGIKIVSPHTLLEQLE